MAFRADAAFAKPEIYERRASRARADARHGMLGGVARGGPLHVAVAWSRARRGRRPRRSDLDTWRSVVHGRVRDTRKPRVAAWARVSSVLAVLAPGDAVVRADGHVVDRVSTVLGTHVSVADEKKLQRQQRWLARAVGHIPSIYGEDTDRARARSSAEGVDRAVGGAARHSEKQGARGEAAQGSAQSAHLKRGQGARSGCERRPRMKPRDGGNAGA